MDLLLRRRMMFTKDSYLYKVLIQSVPTASNDSVATLLVSTLGIKDTTGTRTVTKTVPRVVQLGWTTTTVYDQVTTTETYIITAKEQALTKLNSLPILLGENKTKKEAEVIAVPYREAGAVVTIERMT